MHIFSCPACRATVYFSNQFCMCGAQLCFDVEQYKFVAEREICSNHASINCNWVVEEDGLCRSCHMTEMIPDTFRGDNLWLWAEAEKANRWVLANLSQWNWFTNKDAGRSPRFHFLAEQTEKGHVPVIMGHDDGLITINVTESDPVERVQRREGLSERLRTMTAHFRHEIAHFLFVRLSADETFLKEFRDLFGDETADYGKALKRHYKKGAPDDYQVNYVTRYASSHPHEDWAETVAHLLHLTDILDSAAASGMQRDGMPEKGYDAYAETDGDVVITKAVELGLALNQVNRSMGLQDLYPFVISTNVRQKLIFAHRHVSGFGGTGSAGAK
jgi:hypothetical protein